MNKYTNITAEERDKIGILKAKGTSISEIGRLLGRSKSSISEEVSRNSLGKEYVPIYAHGRSEARKQNTHKRHPLKSPEIYAYVLDKFREGWSPEQIAGRLAKEKGKKVISYETIYRFVFNPKNAHLKLWEYLPLKRVKRYKKYGRKVHRERIPNRVSIHVREAFPEIEGRTEFGHWEGDTVIGSQERGKAIHTECERKIRYYQGVLMESKDSTSTINAQKEVFEKYPCKSVTLDNGLEFVKHEELKPMGIDVYFADPYCSCQRGTNENHNGLLRRYLPKGTNFTELTQEDLDDIIWEINNKPRKILGYSKPVELMEEEMLKCQSVRIEL